MTTETQAAPAGSSDSQTPPASSETETGPLLNGAGSASAGETSPAPEAAASDPQGGAPEKKGDTLLGNGEEGQGGEDKGKPEQSEPAAIEITLPEGYEVDGDVLERFKPIAEKISLNSEGASELAKWYADERAAAIKDAEAVMEKQSEDWRKAVENDPDYGRQKLAESSAFATRGVEWAGEPVRDMIREFGLGNHPELFKFFTRLGRAVGDDNTFVNGGAGGGSGRQSAEDRRDVLYPTMNEDGTPRDGGKPRH